MAGLHKALILLINDQRVELLVWAQRKLSRAGYFRNTTQDHDAFTTQLARWPDYRVIVLADLIDENFRHEHIVHVGGADRDALIKRKLEFAFRSTRYRIGRVKGREKDGRRQDKLLLTAINKPDLLDNWINLLLQHKRAIQAVTSVPWLLRSYVPLAKLDKEPTLLLVNVDMVNHSLRQTFFQEGRLLFSRLTTLSPQAGPLPNEILSETLQVRQYLERIQFVQYDALLPIRVLSATGGQNLDLRAYDSEANRFELVSLHEELGHYLADEIANSVTPAHYALAKVLHTGTLPNIYGLPAMTRYHDLLQLGSRIAMAASVLMCVGLAANAPFVMSIQQKWQQRDSFIARTGPLQREYEALTERFPTTPIPSQEMALIVEATDHLQTELFDPFEALALVGEALGEAPGLSLSKVDWQLVEKAAPPPSADGFDAPVATPLPGLNGNNDRLAQALQEKLEVKVTVTGEAYSSSSFREAQEQVVGLVERLSDYPNVAIASSKLPIDVRTDVAVTTTVNDNEVRAPFTIEFLLKQPEAAAAEDALAQVGEP